MQGRRALFSAAILLGLIAISCDKVFPPNHSLRINNGTGVSLNVTVGDVDFGSVGGRETTQYRKVAVGTLPIGGGLQGSLTIEGNGTHKWTLTINQNGTFDIKED